MATTTSPISDSDVPKLEKYYDNETGFVMYLHDLADAHFPFPGYRDGQGEALYEALESFFVNDYDNVILDLPTGVGKSPLNVTIGSVTAYLAKNKRRIEDHFSVDLDLREGRSFYSTPQKQLRNQLANDADLNPFVDMLKARADYTCGASGKSCADCPIKSDPERSCLETSGCTYWEKKMMARSSDIASMTFAMLIVDKNLPPETEKGQPLSFRNRDIVMVDEGHGLENQAASLFAGFSISPWSLPEDVFADAGSKANWDDDRYQDVERIIREVNTRARNYVRNHEDDPNYENQVEKCENFLRKLDYCQEELENDRPWVVNVTDTKDRNGDDEKKIELKPVYVDDFLETFIWSRGNRRVISSATIPFRDNIQKWCKRIGLPGKTNLISKDMPFPEAHREIHTNTLVGSMSGDDEDDNWDSAMRQIFKIHENHPGEKGLIHSNSYKRAKRAADALGDIAMLHPDDDTETDQVIENWQDSDKDILVSPAMTEGVDLHGDRCRWQALLKVPFGFVGDSRVSYLLNELYAWDWYNETAAIHIQQAVGRAVRGPEPEEAASFYIIDSKFGDLIWNKTSPPKWFSDAISSDPPEHWSNPSAAPWR